MAPAGIPKCVWHHRSAPSLTMAVWAKKEPVTQAWLIPEFVTSWMLHPKNLDRETLGGSCGSRAEGEVGVRELVPLWHVCTHSHISWGCEGRHPRVSREHWVVEQGECCGHLRRASLGDSGTLDRKVGRLGGKEKREKGMLALLGINS